MSVITAPPRKNIFLIWGQYGHVGGARAVPRGRLWLLTDGPDPDATIICRIAWNGTGGQVVYEDLGQVSSARIHANQSAEVYTEVGLVTMVAAPCVCGAGSVGNASPDEGRISLQYLNPHGRPRLTVT